MAGSNPLLKARDTFFERFYRGKLIYNQCWEDPRIDRQVMKIDADSRIVAITSAGCNVLDYLLDEPAQVFAVDINPKQNALLDLKLALYEYGDYEFLFSLFGLGRSSDFRCRYQSDLRPRLPVTSALFWDEHLHYFAGTGLRPSFYFHGTTGLFAWMMYEAIQRDRYFRQAVDGLLESHTLEEQRYWYGIVEPRLWNSINLWLMNRQAVLSLLGVPPQQSELIKNQYPGGLSQFLKDKLRHVFTNIPIHDNYFWRVYLKGSYTRNCLPNYLRPENFEHLGHLLGRIYPFSWSLSEFLERHPGEYSHFVLLDHQDWMARYNVRGLEREWKLILDNSAKGAKILMRSAGPELTFLPEWIHDRLEFDIDTANRLHHQDRVGTYGCFAVGTVR